MKLLHLANFHSTNIGNGALISGTERVLSEDLGADVTFLGEPWDDYTAVRTRRFDAGFVDRVNGTDGLLVGAAVTLDSRPDFMHTGMRLDLPLELWRTVSKPVAFYAISHRMWPSQRSHHVEQFRRTMDYILQHPRMRFSVRNDGSKAWIETLLGYHSDRITTIPDPALYVPTVDSWHPELAEGRVNILVSLNNEDEVYRFGGRPRELAWKWFAQRLDERRLLRAWRCAPDWRLRRRRVLQQLAAALERLAREWDVNIILCPHYFDDYKIISEFVSVCSRRLAYQLMVSSSLLAVARAPYFYDLYAKVDVALSMRIHSMTPAIGLGTPCVALVSQSRMSAFLADAGLEGFGVDLFDASLAERVYERLTHCLTAREQVRRRFQAVRAAMRQRSAAYHQSLVPLFSSSARSAFVPVTSEV